MSENKYHKRFDSEYKKVIVRLVEELGKSPVEVAKDINVSAQSVRCWVQQYGTHGSAAFPGKGKLHPEDKEMRKLKKRNKDLEEENAILKKAMGIFAKDGR